MKLKFQRKKNVGTGSVFLRHPLFTTASLACLYFVMDDQLLYHGIKASTPTALFCLVLTLSLFCLCYPVESLRKDFGSGEMGMPIWVNRPKRYRWIGYALLLVVVAAALVLYGLFGSKWFPNLAAAYYPSQLVIFLLIAPVMEELTFRYFLYDIWARPKYGTVWGAVASGLIFVACHPVTGWQTFCLYWIPTAVFYVVYHDYGIYGSVLAHMVYNFLAI